MKVNQKLDQMEQSLSHVDQVKVICGFLWQAIFRKAVADFIYCYIGNC